MSLALEILKVRDGQGGGYDDFPGSRREEEQRNSYSAFDYSESSEGEVEAGCHASPPIKLEGGCRALSLAVRAFAARWSSDNEVMATLMMGWW